MVNDYLFALDEDTYCRLQIPARIMDIFHATDDLLRKRHLDLFGKRI